MDDIQLDAVEHAPINIYDITSHRLEYHTGSPYSDVRLVSHHCWYRLITKKYKKHDSLRPPGNIIKEYVQETQCAGCDDLPAEAVLFKEKLGSTALKHVWKTMLHVELFFF